MPLLRHLLVRFSTKHSAINSSPIPPQRKPSSDAKSGLGPLRPLPNALLRLHGAQDLKSRDDIAECHHQAGATEFLGDGARSDTDFAIRAFVERPTGLSPFVEKIGYQDGLGFTLQDAGHDPVRIRLDWYEPIQSFQFRVYIAKADDHFTARFQDPLNSPK